MKMTDNDVDTLTKAVAKKMRLDVTWNTRSQKSNIYGPLKRMGKITEKDDVFEVINKAVDHASSVIMIQEGFNKKARIDVKDTDALFSRKWNKEYIMEEEWEMDHDKWKEVMANQYCDLFEKTLKKKLKEKFQ